jgi:hypothetical protein
MLIKDSLLRDVVLTMVSLARRVLKSSRFSRSEAALLLATTAAQALQHASAKALLLSTPKRSSMSCKLTLIVAVELVVGCVSERARKPRRLLVVLDVVLVVVLAVVLLVDVLVVEFVVLVVLVMVVVVEVLVLVFVVDVVLVVVVL